MNDVTKGNDVGANMDLDYYQSLANKENENSSRLPSLKINYDSDSKVVKKGEWVLGQKKDANDKIIEEGSKVTSVVILKIRNQYFYYDEDDNKNNCVSSIHKNYEEVTGSNYKHVCGKNCPYREDDRKPRCSAQKVVFMLAMTADKKVVPCVSYLKGTGFMPIIEYVQESTKLIVGAKVYDIPYFAFITKLSSEKHKKGTVMYYVPIFTRGQVFSTDRVEKMELKVKDVDNYISTNNQKNVTSNNTTEQTTVKVDTTTVEVVDDDGFFDDDKKVETKKIEKVVDDVVVDDVVDDVVVDDAVVVEEKTDTVVEDDDWFND